MDMSIREKTPAEQEAERIAADLLNDRDKAGKAHRAQERRGLDAQMNDKTAEFGGWAA